MFWDKEIELLPRAELEALQLARLVTTVEQAQKAPFYRKVFSQEGLSSSSIKTLDDLRRFPFTMKEDLRAAFPSGFLAVP